MTTLMQKLRVVTLGAAHDLLDKAIDLDSPSAIRQYVRDLEEALDRMRNEAAVQAGGIRTLEREIGDLQSKIETGKQTIIKLREGGHDDLARPKAAMVVTQQRTLESDQNNLTGMKNGLASLDAAITQVDSKHQDMVARVRELERMDRDTKAKEQTASALHAAGRLVSGGADMSVDDVQKRMQERNDVATEKFNRAMGSVQTTEDPDTTAAVDDLLDSLAPKAKTASNV
jgi:phage shock protein A